MNEEPKQINKLVSTLTTIPTKTLDKISEISTYVIEDLFANSEYLGSQTTACDIGIGILQIYHDERDLKFRFIPSTKLQEGIQKVLNHENEDIQDKIEKSLVDTLVLAYKELL